MHLSANLILGSGSPRRKELLAAAGFQFEVITKPTDETYPAEILPQNVAEYLAYKKNKAFFAELDSSIVLTADTVVVINDHVLGKPDTPLQAQEMLGLLSGNKHTVITGVCIGYKDQLLSFSDTTDVFFTKLTKAEIESYIQMFKPFDKAGGYGIQEWIGYIGIEKIVGSFYNVMGLPIQKVYTYLSTFK